MLRSGICALMVAFAAAPVVADEIGADEFANSCAQCHGANGKGDGPISPYLLNTPPDLTALSQMNGGEFPAAAVYDFIDGTADVAAHGGRDMPVWGDRYKASATSQRGETADMVARGRILSLVYYLESIQE